MTDQKTPPSEMIRVPTALIPAVKTLSKLHRQGHTIALLQELEELIAKFDSKIDSDISPSSKSVKQLETKLEVIIKKLEQMERAIASSASGRYSNNTRPRRQAHSYQQPQVELQPRTNESLAQRLGVTPESLIAEREKLTPKEFLSYTRHRDPMSTAWEYHPNDGLYHPLK